MSLLYAKQEKNSTANVLNPNTNQPPEFENAIQARLGSSDFKTVKPTLLPTVVRFKDRIRTQKANMILRATLNNNFKNFRVRSTLAAAKPLSQMPHQNHTVLPASKVH